MFEHSQIWLTGPTLREALQKGARYILVGGGASPAIFLPGGCADINFAKVEPLVRMMAELFEKSKEYRVTTPGGTDVSGKLGATVKPPRKGRCISGFANKPGGYSGAPHIEASFAPIEGTSNGVVVIDACLNTMVTDLNLLRAPIKITIKDGKALKFEGGGDADRVAQWLEYYKDQNVYNLAEIAIGMNPKAKMSGRVCEAEAVWGSTHIALGDNRGYNGVLAAPVHLDMISLPGLTMWLDGKVVWKDGKMLIAEIPKEALVNPVSIFEPYVDPIR
jgi:leucyl aminopeptidase (aminopeptidase T)